MCRGGHVPLHYHPQGWKPFGFPIRPGGRTPKVESKIRARCLRISSRRKRHNEILQGSDSLVAVATLKEPRPAAGEFSIHFGALLAAAIHCSAASAYRESAPYPPYMPPGTILMVRPHMLLINQEKNSPLPMSESRWRNIDEEYL